MKYQVEIGTWRHTVNSCCVNHALIDALKRWPPKVVTLLARGRKVGGRWAYIGGSGRVELLPSDYYAEKSKLGTQRRKGE